MSYPNSDLCPLHIKESLLKYVDGRPTGGFLQCVLENDLTGAIGMADDDNLEMLPHIVAFVMNCIPRSAWGDEHTVDAWLERKRKEREAQS